MHRSLSVFIRLQCWLVYLLLVSSSYQALFGQTTESESKQVDYAKSIQPILAKHCYACHGPDTQESSLGLHNAESAYAETDSGLYAIVPGSPETSEMLNRIRSTDEFDRMPPEGKRLSADEMELIENWISQGAAYTEHWAFQPIQQVSVPNFLPHQDASRDWPDGFLNNPIDAFILDSLTENGLRPAAPAPDATWFRRVYYAVTGLPPTYQDRLNFERSPNYSQTIDRLLADPKLGQRWGRHWLDVVRYAETNSFERDGAKPNAWKYRDYVIDAMNEDKAYDDFVIEQLAGDEIEEPTRESLTATGYYRLGIWDDEPADPLLAIYEGYDDLVTTTSQGLMGLTINCARCHDHKIDPIPQTDYYQMVAFLRDVTPYGARNDQNTNSQIELSPPKHSERFAELETEIKGRQQRKRATEQDAIVKMSAENQRATEGPERRKVLRRELHKHLTEAEMAEYRENIVAISKLQRALRDLPDREFTLGLAKCNPQPETTFVLTRGIPQAPAEPVAPGYPDLFGSSDPSPESLTATPRSAGRRIELAKWMVSSDNFLTARVYVNRIWQHYFGRGIVRSPNNFGLLGTPPTHPLLLDFLASELIRNDWSAKSIHRLILTSNAFRMQSFVTNHRAQEIDPANDLYWKFDSRRLSAEELRDSVLSASGTLSLEHSGPSIYPKLSADVLASQSRPGEGWHDSPPDQLARRSVYIHIKRSLIPPELSAFDFPEPDTSCEARFLTTQPAQAFTMMNGSFMQEQARIVAERLSMQSESFDIQCELAVQMILARASTEFDQEHANKFRKKIAETYNTPDSEILRLYCLVLLNSNEFLYVD